MKRLILHKVHIQWRCTTYIKQYTIHIYIHNSHEFKIEKNSLQSTMISVVFLKLSTFSQFRKLVGKLFQSFGPTVLKDLSENVLFLLNGIS